MEIPEKYRRAFFANAAVLRTTSPRLCALVLDAAAGMFARGPGADGGRGPGDFVLETARNGELTLRKSSAYLESRTEPAKNALAYAEKGRGGAATILFLGCGLGYHINALLRGEGSGRDGPGGCASRFILVEREPAVFAASLAVLEPRLFPRLTPLVGLSADEIAGRLKGAETGRIEVVRHPRSIRLHPRFYAAIENEVLKLLKGALASSVTERANARLWVRNILKNVRGVTEEYGATAGFSNRFAGPVVLAASGPRLEDAARFLETLRGRVPILALLPSYSFLAAEGIEPDLLVTTDAGFWNRLRHVRGAKAPLLAAWSAEPVLLRNWPGGLAFFSHGLPLETAVGGLSASSLSVPMQGTASAVMILLARAMGFDEIYLVGYDFAYRGMKDHHKGAGFDDALLASSCRFRSWHTMAAERFRLERIVETSGDRGQKVRTSGKLLLYRDWIERELAGSDLFRVTGGAAMRMTTSPLPEGDVTEKLRDSGGGEAFRAALPDLMRSGRLPPGLLRDEMRSARDRLAAERNPRETYRFFFGDPGAGVAESEIEGDAAWALGALSRHWSGRWNR